jgi:hypothetical protein
MRLGDVGGEREGVLIGKSPWAADFSVMKAFACVMTERKQHTCTRGVRQHFFTTQVIANRGKGVAVASAARPVGTILGFDGVYVLFSHFARKDQGTVHFTSVAGGNTMGLRGCDETKPFLPT